MPVNINSLGLRLDGWADLVEDTGPKAEEAFKAASQVMNARGMPNVVVTPTQISAGTFSSKQRPYILAQMPNGASVTVYVGVFGKDLYASWDLYVRPLLNWRTLLIILGVSVLLVGPCGLIGLISGFSSLGNRYTSGFALPSIIGSLFLTCGGIFFTALILAALVAVAGTVIKGTPLGFFFKELDNFDADDIGAMSLAVHKSVLHALDQVGISTQALRLKEQFKAGSRERLI